MAKKTFLDFEQPIAELESKIEELRYVQTDSAVDISEEIDQLSKKSQQLTKDIYAELSPWQITKIARHPERPYTLVYVHDIFTVVVELHGDRHYADDLSIVGQQVSVASAQAVWERFVALVPRGLKPASVLKLKIDDMRAAGLSARKVDYLVDLAMHFEGGKLHVKDWAAMDDEAIIAELVAIRGIGRWTAEIFLMFHLMRPNVLPLDDVGLINGISKNYFSGESVSRSDAREVAAAWSPYCSVATWYIWRSLDPLPVLSV